MKRFAAAFLVAMIFLGGCNSANDSLQSAISFREKIINSQSCQFQTEICADFGQMQYTFSLACRAEKDGTLFFEVLSPQSIAGISGYIDQQSGKLTFDETVLTFPHLAEGELSPVCAPWLFYKAISSGYLRASGAEGDLTRLSIDDSFQGENLDVEVWMKDGLPVCAEIVWQGRNILTLTFSEFKIL